MFPGPKARPLTSQFRVTVTINQNLKPQIGGGLSLDPYTSSTVLVILVTTRAAQLFDVVEPANLLYPSSTSQRLRSPKQKHNKTKGRRRILEVLPRKSVLVLSCVLSFIISGQTFFHFNIGFYILIHLLEQGRPKINQPNDPTFVQAVTVVSMQIPASPEIILNAV